MFFPQGVFYAALTDFLSENTNLRVIGYIFDMFGTQFSRICVVLGPSVEGDDNNRFFSGFSFSFKCDPESLCALPYFENEIHF